MQVHRTAKQGRKVVVVSLTAEQILTVTRGATCVVQGGLGDVTIVAPMQPNQTVEHLDEMAAQIVSRLPGNVVRPTAAEVAAVENGPGIIQEP